ncbi:hypothetical protein EYF80_013504 [Liparis tanakae]|uniref:Uncharacterized protein n=1 Tax=Liparis tanakae TaxID=230148 RepID=A0A4Z2IE19_9TELE|nr:hypothetical protein EYF80_013504 [Liparis tanakae]
MLTDIRKGCLKDEPLIDPQPPEAGAVFDCLRESCRARHRAGWARRGDHVETTWTPMMTREAAPPISTDSRLAPIHAE